MADEEGSVAVPAIAAPIGRQGGLIPMDSTEDGKEQGGPGAAYKPGP